MAATHPYAELLGNADPLAVLADTQIRIPAIADTLGPDGLESTYSPGKWSAAQIISHLADCEMAFGYRVRQIIAEPSLPIQPFDQDLWARHYAILDGVLATDAFQAMRGWNLALFRRLSPEDLNRTALHPKRGPETALTVIRIMAGHTLNHVAQLEKILAG